MKPTQSRLMSPSSVFLAAKRSEPRREIARDAAHDCAAEGLFETYGAFQQHSSAPGRSSD
jgi:hypothetical protein